VATTWHVAVRKLTIGCVFHHVARCSTRKQYGWLMVCYSHQRRLGGLELLLNSFACVPPRRQAAVKLSMHAHAVRLDVMSFSCARGCELLSSFTTSHVQLCAFQDACLTSAPSRASSCYVYHRVSSHLSCHQGQGYNSQAMVSVL